MGVMNHLPPSWDDPSNTCDATSPYPLPTVPSAPVRWFKVSRLAVNWALLMDNIGGFAGQLFSDPSDGYVSAGLTFADEHRLETLGRLGGTVAEAKCSVTLRVNITFVEASDPGQAVECKATAFGVGGWLWPDTAGEGKLWLTCANDTEFGEDNWVQRYAEATSDSTFSFTSNLEKSPDSHQLKSQIARALELAVAPTVIAGVSLLFGSYRKKLNRFCLTLQHLDAAIAPLIPTWKFVSSGVGLLVAVQNRC
eukprot:symbB.v1.2.004607.t1/scaffold259.1/size252385/9